MSVKMIMTDYETALVKAIFKDFIREGEMSLIRGEVSEVHILTTRAQIKSITGLMTALEELNLEEDEPAAA